MESNPINDKKPWYIKNAPFIVIYIALWIFIFIVFSNLSHLFNTGGLSYPNIVLVVMFVLIVLLLLNMPFRYHHFQNNKNFGELNSKIFETLENLPDENQDSDNLSLTDYKIQLEKFFEVTLDQNTIILNSYVINDKKKDSNSVYLWYYSFRYFWIVFNIH